MALDLFRVTAARTSVFNASLEGNTRRAIDFHEGEKIDEEALMTLVRAAVTLNKSTAQS